MYTIITTASPRRQWLRERASILRLYVAHCLSWLVCTHVLEQTSEDHFRALAAVKNTSNFAVLDMTSFDLAEMYSCFIGPGMNWESWKISVLS
jgi:hypothetical protein